MTGLVPFLTFQPGKGQSAAEAIEFYTSLFSDGVIVSESRYGPEGPGPEGSVQVAEFVTAGHRIRCSDSFVDHEWDFTPAVSLWLEFDQREELQRIFDALADGGKVHMPLDDYGFGPFGWVDDRFAVSWQLVVTGTVNSPAPGTE